MVEGDEETLDWLNDAIHVLHFVGFDIITTAYQQPSSPSTKELHEWAQLFKSVPRHFMLFKQITNIQLPIKQHPDGVDVHCVSLKLN